MVSSSSSAKVSPKKRTHPPPVPLSSVTSKERAYSPPEPLPSAATSTSLKEKRAYPPPEPLPLTAKNSVTTNTTLPTTAFVSTNTNTETDEIDINNKIVFIITL